MERKTKKKHVSIWNIKTAMKELLSQWTKSFQLKGQSANRYVVNTSTVCIVECSNPGNSERHWIFLKQNQNMCQCKKQNLKLSFNESTPYVLKWKQNKSMRCPVRSEACFLYKADYRMLPVWSTKADTLGMHVCVNSPEPFTNRNALTFSCSSFIQYKWSPLGTHAYQSAFTPNHYPLATKLESTPFDKKDCTQLLRKHREVY